VLLAYGWVTQKCPVLKLKLAGLCFDVGVFLLGLGDFFFPLEDKSNVSKVHTMKSTHHNTASKPKQAKALLSSTWPLHHV